MGYKKQILGLICVSAGVSIATFLAFYFEGRSLEFLSSLFARKIYYLEMEKVFEPVLLLSVSLTISLLPLYFLKEGVFKAWRTFALIYLPIAIFLILISPEYLDNSSFVGISFGADRESTTIATSAFFLLISLILITYKSISLRKK